MTITVTKPEMTSVSFEEDVRVEYERRFFLGIIKWWSVKKIDHLGKDLVILTHEKYDRIVVNGEEVIKP